MIGEGLPTRKQLPKTLIKNHFIVQIPLKSEEEEEESGLVESEVVEDIQLNVVQIGEGCVNIVVGDEVMMNPSSFLNPISVFKIGDLAYYVYNEHNVVGIW